MDFNEARKNMVCQQIEPWAVSLKNVLEAFADIPREMFVPPQYTSLSYADISIPLGNEQTMLPPKIIGRALQALDIQPHETVLEIGTGTGYATACLGRLAQQVTSIEIQPELAQIAKRNLDNTRESGNITLKEGDGLKGYEPQSPYDVIFVTGSYPMGAPQSLLSQLKDNGRLFVICGQPPAMRAILITKQNKKFETKQLFETVVPSLSHAPHPEKFVL